MRILVADDDVAVQKMLDRTLRELGHEVVGIVSSGDELARRVVELRPDVVTLDIDMPGPDAYRLAHALCHEHRVAVVVVSGYSELELAPDLAQTGIGAVVRKPFSLQELAIAVEVAAARFRDREDLRHYAEAAYREQARLLDEREREREREREVHRMAERRRRELTLLSKELVAATSAGDLSQRCVVRVREALGAGRVRMVTSLTEGKSWLVTADTEKSDRPRGASRPPDRLGLAGYVLVHKETVRSLDLRSETRFQLDETETGDRSVIAAPMVVGDQVVGALVCTSTEPSVFDADAAHLVTLMANQAAMALENLRLGARLADQQKLAALGLMAAGVVHEIKNPLVYIQANIESAEEVLGKIVAGKRIDPARLDEDRAALAEARAGCTRVFKIIDDIKTFAHPGRAQRDLNDVNRLVDVALTLSAQEMRRWCKVVRDFGRIPLVSCDGTRISQVVLNLLVNAAQSLERGGRVGTVEIATRVEDCVVRITVADDGPGMDPKVLDKVFLPFFTTKPPGMGTGLGLSISRRLMETQGGTIEVESAPGKGARFTVVLPVSESAARATESA